MDWALPIAIGRSRLYIGRSETQHFQNFRPGDLKTWKSQNLEKTRAEKWSRSVWSKVLQLPWCVDWWQNRCLMLDAWCMLDGSWRTRADLALPRAPGPDRPPLAMSHEPWALSHEPLSMHQASSICFVTNQHTTEVEALLTRQISIIFRRASFRNFEISRFSILKHAN